MSTVAAPVVPVAPAAHAQPASPPAPLIAAAPVVAPAAAPKGDKWRSALAAKDELLGAKEQLKTLTPKAARLDSMLALAKSDPLKFLEETGLTFQDVAAAKAKQLGVPAKPEAAPAVAAPDLKPVEDRVAGIEKKLTDAELAAKTANETRLKQETDAYVANIGEALKAGAANHPLLSDFPNAAAVVFQKIKEEYKRTGKALSAEEAAPLVEADIKAQLDTLKAKHPNLVRYLVPTEAGPEPIRDAPSGTRKDRMRRLPAGVPAAMAKPLPAAAAEAPVSRGAPSAVKMRPGESFAAFMVRKEAAKG